jgi:hypothetical protein
MDFFGLLAFWEFVGGLDWESVVARWGEIVMDFVVSGKIFLLQYEQII